ncbi:hypothetical protein [Caenimonas sp. SL110]|uniref:hypothetical protein n=1 Tax=Caenimonas sp. SL110 TaxID=1450524 RepID=UPI000653004B|nr:hypothetical protein [Caenimonas sp. SL110]
MPTHFDPIHAENYLQRMALVGARSARNQLLASFEEPFGKVNDAYERFDFDKEGQSWDEYLSLYRSLVDDARFGHAQNAVTRAAGDVARMIICGFTETLDEIEGGAQRLPVGKYRLGADLRVTQEATISSIIINFFAPAVSDARDVELRRAWLASNLEAYSVLPGEEMDIGQVARGFGLGALAFAHPLLGVPALISNWANDGKQKKAATDRDAKYEEAMAQFYERVEAFREQLLNAADQSERYVLEKWREINVRAIMTVLSELAAAGHSVQHYLDEMDLNELDELEAQAGLGAKT